MRPRRLTPGACALSLLALSLLALPCDVAPLRAQATAPLELRFATLAPADSPLGRSIAATALRSV